MPSVDESYHDHIWRLLLTFGLPSYASGYSCRTPDQQAEALRNLNALSPASHGDTYRTLEPFMSPHSLAGLNINDKLLPQIAEAWAQGRVNIPKSSDPANTMSSIFNDTYSPNTNVQVLIGALHIDTETGDTPLLVPYGMSLDEEDGFGDIVRALSGPSPSDEDIVAALANSRRNGRFSPRSWALPLVPYATAAPKNLRPF